MIISGDHPTCTDCGCVMIPMCVSGCGAGHGTRMDQHRALAAARAEAWSAIEAAFGKGWTDAKHRASRALGNLERQAILAGRATEKWSHGRKVGGPCGGSGRRTP